MHIVVFYNNIFNKKQEKSSYINFAQYKKAHKKQQDLSR